VPQVVAVHRSSSHSFSMYAEDRTGSVRAGDAIPVQFPAPPLAPLVPA
jgi:hypothetical protein